ncbi:FG-GAP repeat domain-containing protein [Microbacterium sp. NPDC089695]|uniref:FG-GAP repeat domain-containing protein n=1 Tax=Microbacterium sp. NPDC089695 TaxID=3364198 RepID=UPI0037F8C529
MPQILATFIAVSALVVGVIVPSASASAITASSIGVVQAREVKTTLAGFSAGNIISDRVFTNKNTMTEAQIQSFFNSKVSRCLGGRDEDGKAIVCLKDFRITSVSRPADAYCNGYTGAANESAARIIYRVAQSCNINPQVLIVMLQKEQGLITHTWPSAWRYNIALGQGCPDTAPCDPNFIGFFHQIYGAARQMQIYMEGKWFQWYAPGKTWNILYHPNSACGSGRVYIANAATAALYYYTPYQPNAAALRAGYGLGNSCSAYGNRNFYNYFTDWFGSTQGGPSIPPPVLASTSSSSFMVSADTAGKVWGYPFSRGAWGSRVELATGLGAVRDVLGVGDLNGDGHRDFVALTEAGGAYLLPGDGGTNLGNAVVLAGDWSGIVLAAQAGDFNGDGIPDIFTTNSRGELQLRAGDDRGGFRAPVVVGTGWGGMNLISGVDNLRGDGRFSLVARDGAGRLFSYPQVGAGQWGTRTQIGSGWSGMTDVFSPGDFTGDGVDDLFAQTAAGAMVLYRGVKGGGLLKHGTVGTGWQTMTARSSSGEAASAPRALPGGAGNVDGVPGGDVIAVNAAGQLLSYGATGSGNWTGRVQQLSTGWTATDRLVTLGDFTGDGLPDVGRVAPDGSFFLYAGKAGGGFDAPTRIGSGWNAFTAVIGNIDVDGDRIPDVLAVDSGGRLLLYRGSGAGGWAPGGGAVVGNGWGGFDAIVSVGDLDGDGSHDLIARSADGRLTLYAGTGTGSWKAPRVVGSGWGAMTHIIGSGDFNGDGVDDVLAVGAGGQLYLYRGDGNGGWRAGLQIGNGWQSMRQIG